MKFMYICIYINQTFNTYIYVSNDNSSVSLTCKSQQSQYIEMSMKPQAMFGHPVLNKRLLISSLCFIDQKVGKVISGSAMQISTIKGLLRHIYKLNMMSIAFSLIYLPTNDVMMFIVYSTYIQSTWRNHGPCVSKDGDALHLLIFRVSLNSNTMCQGHYIYMTSTPAHSCRCQGH